VCLSVCLSLGVWVWMYGCVSVWVCVGVCGFGLTLTHFFGSVSERDD